MVLSLLSLVLGHMKLSLQSDSLVYLFTDLPLSAIDITREDCGVSVHIPPAVEMWLMITLLLDLNWESCFDAKVRRFI